jgi:hypothetical protein
MDDLSADHLALLLRIKGEIEDGRMDQYFLFRSPIRSKTLRSITNNKTKKGGGLDKKTMILVLFSIVFIISFSVDYANVREYFESLLLNPSIFWETILLPFLNRLKELKNEKHSLALTLFGKSVHTVVIPTIKGVYKKITDSVTGDVLALNGLWALWTNMIKFKDYIKSPKDNNEITPEKMKEIYEKGLSDINHIIFYITVPKDFKMLSIPYGSKLITNKGICDT